MTSTMAMTAPGCVADTWRRLDSAVSLSSSIRDSGQTDASRAKATVRRDMETKGGSTGRVDSP
jgi:hypothetical protein